MDLYSFLELLKIELSLNGMAYPSSGTGVVSGLLSAPDKVAELWELLQGLFANFVGIFQDLSQIIHILDFLPGPWVALFLVLLTIVVALRIYSFFSDVEIGGFKI